MFENKTLRFIFGIIAVVLVTAYISGLNIDVTRDAGKYATVAKEIYQNGNFINLTVHGEAYDQKPPMLFWLGALGFTIGKVSNFWFKFPVLLLVFAGFYWAFRLGESLYNKRVGLLTATMLLFSFIYLMYSMDIHTDTPLQAFITLAFWQLFAFIKTKKNQHWILGFIAVGLAMLTKGPIGAAIPAFAVIGHLVFKRDFKSLLDYRWYLGILLSFVIVSPALIGLMNQFGWEGIRFFFWENNVGRITGSYVKATNDPIFYVHNIAYLFLPWSLLFFIAVFMEFKTLIQNKFRSAEYFTLTGIWIYFIILNSASSQLPNYVFSIVPLMAVVTAKWIDISLSGKTRLLNVFTRVQHYVVLLLWVGIFFVSFYLFPTPAWLNMILVFAGIILTFYITRQFKEPVSRLIFPSLIVFTCLAFIMNTHVFPYMFSFQAPPKAARYFTEYAEKGDTLYNYHYDEYELFFYSEPQATQLYSADEMKAVAGKKGAWIFTDEKGFDEIEKLNISPEFIFEYKHLYLNRPGKFINPRNRNKVLYPMYLIKY
ncbi:MAG: glycosyltransferase family 39 protein [Prolixibacteraceae bacterium]|nr:glycosyltransferase family 39 protein [Prolixibacteraceae bacterium]